MNEAALVRVMNRFADAAHQLQTLGRGAEMLTGEFQQGFAVDELHGEIGLGPGPRVRGAVFVYLGNAMVEASQGMRLQFEAPQDFGACDPTFDNLERNCSVWILLLRFIDHAHAAVAERAQNAIAVDDRGDGGI